MHNDRLIGLIIGIIIAVLTWFLLAPALHHALFFIYNMITGKDVQA